MNLTKILGVLTVASMSLAAAAGSGACSSSSTSSGLASSTPPSGTTFSGGTFGGDCAGEVFAIAGTGGWAYCDGGKWAYTTDDPAQDGYTQYSPDGGGPTVDAAPGIDVVANDVGTPEASTSDAPATSDAKDDGASGDDGGQGGDGGFHQGGDGSIQGH